MLDAFDLDLQMIFADLLRVLIAFILAFPLAWDRSQSERRIGLRTFPLVAIASCGFYLVAKHNPDASGETLARVIQGIMTGIGFIGGGAILKQDGNVKGLATATSIWNTGAIGLAVASERVEIAVVLSLINFLLLRLLTPLAVSRDEEKKVD
jgi:putative Mg2+ transporter-C (MgtC) family protein